MSILAHIILGTGKNFRYMATSGIARVKGFHNSTLFDIAKLFSSACTSVPLHQQGRRVSVAPHPCHLLLVYLFVLL